MPTTFHLNVEYSQIAVFQAGLDRPFNNWTDRHVEQGFSWRDESVSFRVPNGGDCIVELLSEQENSSLIGTATRAIQVPYNVTKENTVVASIGDERSIRLPFGLYQLTFELIPDAGIENVEYEYGIRLRFRRTERPVFAILIRDEELTAEGDLLTTAEPAL